jgi:hypothetical protein
LISFSFIFVSACKNKISSLSMVASIDLLRSSAGDKEVVVEVEIEVEMGVEVGVKVRPKEVVAAEIRGGDKRESSKCSFLFFESECPLSDFLFFELFDPLSIISNSDFRKALTNDFIASNRS